MLAYPTVKFVGQCLRIRAHHWHQWVSVALLPEWIWYYWSLTYLFVHNGWCHGLLLGIITEYSHLRTLSPMYVCILTSTLNTSKGRVDGIAWELEYTVFDCWWYILIFLVRVELMLPRTLANWAPRCQLNLFLVQSHLLVLILDGVLA